MDIIKWQNIIIEWVNCLKLSKPVLVIDDLKDGQFFKELHGLLSKTDKTTQITDFLKKHYPAFILENESAEIRDSVEITYAYSLLLHYCSLVDCSEQFILPLCKDLNYKSQIFVKNFLEDLQLSTVITRDILKNAIYKMNKYASTPTKSISSSFSSPKTPNNTPLLEYLKTPHKKINEEIHHRREVKQLQAQLDLERFEKADLQEELNFQYEKNKKLDKNISDNQTEIRRLRAKVLSLENMTPPSNHKQDRNIENKRLRDEIGSLEKYVEILHKEQEELQTERDKARDKLRKIEENTNDWQTKCITHEKQLQKLTEENKNYLQELFNLRERCEELSTMLHELNPKKMYDESYEADLFLCDDGGSYNKSGSLVDSASLAQTVIDVQLVDAQNENKKLKIQLHEMDNEITRLQQINQVAQNTLDTIKIELEETSCVNTNLNEIIQELNEKTTELESTLNFTQKENNNLIDELKLTTEMNKSFIEKLNSEIKNLIQEKDCMNEKLSEITQKAENYELLNNKFEQFNSDVEKCIIKFKCNLNYEKEFPKHSTLIEQFSTLINVFEIKNINNTKIISNLQESYQSLLNQISNFEQEITTLNSNEVERKREIDHLKVSLKTAENKIEHYEKEVVTNYENLIEKYKSIIEEKCGMISELTKLKDVLINKENTIIKLQNEHQELQNEILEEQNINRGLEKNYSNLKNVLTEKDNFIKSLELEKSNLENNYEDVNERLKTEMNQIKNLKTIIQEFEEKVESFNSETVELKENIKNFKDELSQLNTDKNELNRENETLKSNQQELENNLSKTESEKRNFEFLYNQTKQTLNEKIAYTNDLNNQKHDLENQIDGLNNQLKTLEEDLSQEKTLKDELNNDLKQVKHELVEEKTMINELCEEIEEKSKEICELQTDILNLNENINCINCEVFNIMSMLQSENENIQTKEKTVENLNKHLINLKNQLSLSLEEKKETMEEVKYYKQKIEHYKNEFETYKYELESVFDEINSHLNELKPDSPSSESETKEDLSILEVLRETLNTDHQKDKEILGEMLQKVIKLKHNIYNLVQENHRVQSEMNTLQKQYNILDELKTNVEQKLSQLTEESSNKITELNEQLLKLQQENDQYVSNLETYRENLNKAHETFAETQISVDGLIKKHKMETENYKESVGELKKKNGKLEEQVHHLKSTEKSLTEELFTHQSKLKNLLDDYNTTVRLNEDIKDKKETLSKKLHKQTESFEELQGSLSKTSLELEASLREIEMYKSLKAEFEKSFTALNKDHENIVNNYETKIKKLKEENDELKDETEELIKEMAKTKDKLNIEKVKQNDLDIRMKNFTLETEKLEEKVLQLKSKLQNMEEERQGLIVEHEELKEKTNSMIQETKLNHEEELQQLQSQINELNKELDQNKKQFEDYEMKKVEFEKLQKDNISLQNIIDHLYDDKEMLSLKVEQLNEDLVILKSRNDEQYKDKLDEINEVKTKLSYTLSLIENIYKLLENELDKTSVELKQTKTEDNVCVQIENEIINLSSCIEQLLEKKNQLNTDLENITIKVEQEKLYYEQKLEEMKQENNGKLQSLNKQNTEIIESLEKRLKKEEKTSQIYLKEVENLNTQLINKIDEIEKVSNEKQNLIKEYEIIANKVSLLKKSRNDLAEDHHKIIKTVETYILRTQESVINIKKDFTKRLEEQRENNESLTKQLENFLKVEKSNVSFLEKRTEDLIQEKQQLINITSKSFTSIHELYTKLFDDNDVTEQINKLKQNKSEIEDELQSINFEQEIVDKEIELINNEIIELKKIHEEMANYELVKSDYVTLKNKYNLMSVCETENNGYKLKISDLENKLSDLQNENTKYQKEITELQKEYNNIKDEHIKEVNLMQSRKKIAEDKNAEIELLENKLTDLQNENTKYQKEITELQKECNNIKDEHIKEVNLMQSRKKIAEDKNAEIELLIEKYASEMKEISDSNIELHKTVKELEDKLYLNEELIFQEKCKNDDLQTTNIKLEKEVEKQTLEKERLITEGKIDYDIMNQKYEVLSTKSTNLENEILGLEEKLAKYKQIINELEHDNLNLNKNQTELKQQIKQLLQQNEDKVDKASYTNLIGENSRLQLDCTVLKKTIDERNSQLSELTFIKESYEKLLEDNNKSHMELDTLRYKRTRDKEEFKRLLEEEKAKGATNADTQITEIRNEYEEKLKKMKEKMVNLYKEEMEREKKRITLKLSQSEEIVQSLKSQLWVTGNKNVDQTKEIERLRDQLRSMKEKLQLQQNDDFRGSRESMSSLKERERRPICDVEERRISTLPRDSRQFQRPQVNIIEETVTVSRKRRSITGGGSGISNLDQGLKMEDEEGELFNNTYLSDLKAGRCIESGRESVSSRISELQYRNSLCPPHLKSSYPAETQFQSPGQFKEEDLKMGTVDLDDSMSSSLLPGEKPRMKKDWGQTMYKKPGPPTPSKNGGRLSLQGNEVHPRDARDVLREQNDNNKASGRTTSTPSRIKMLFARSGSNSTNTHRSNDSENISTPPKGKRRSIFRR